jgi:hypothetical protein
MAMDKDKLGLALSGVVVSASSVPPGPDQLANLQAFWKDMADAIITHIQDNAEVPAGIAVSTSGSPSAQTGETTTSGTVK